MYLDEARAIEQIGDVATLRKACWNMLQEMLERDVPEIARLLQAGCAQRQSPLHSLKGCMPIFAAPSLCEHLARVEHMSKAGAPRSRPLLKTCARSSTSCW